MQTSFMKSIPQPAPKTAPALKHAKKSLRRNLPPWNALSASGHLPEYSMFENAVTSGCNASALRDIASKDTCSACPLAETVTLLFRNTKA